MNARIIAPLWLATLGLAAPAQAASTVVLTPPSGHPGLPVTISGASFGAGEAIDVYVDTVDTLLLVSSATGAFSGSVTIPPSAQPGKHYITAIGRHSGDAAQGAFVVTTAWAEQGFGAAHLAWNPYENTLNTSNVGNIGPLWQIPSNGAGDAPAVASGRVFLSYSGGLEAVSAATGAVLWKSLPGSVLYASPAVIGSALYIGDGAKSMMYALNAGTGATIWSKATGGVFQSSPVVTGGLVYAGNVDDKIYAFSAVSGNIVWTYTTNGYIDSSPAVVGGILYVGSSDDSIYALSATSGVLIWSYKTGGAVESSPAISNGVVYVGSDDGKFYAVSATGPNTGSTLWTYAAGGAIYAGPAVAYGMVYFGSTDGNVYAVNAHSGALVWSVATGGVVESPAVANGIVYVTSRSGGIYALDAHTGNILASGMTGYSFLGNPTISDGVVYLNTYNYGAYAFALNAGVNAAPVQKQAPQPASLHPDMSLVAVP